MENILSYLKWRGDISFAERHFCEVDNLILSELAYLDFKGILPSEESQDEMPVKLVQEKMKEAGRKGTCAMELPEDFLQVFAQSRRFGTSRLSHFTDVQNEKTQTQFSAVQIHLEDGSIYIAFRGTGDELVGWREDFSMTLCAAFQENTKCVVAETIANPALVVLDIEKFAKAAHAHQVPLIVDNTFATPINCNPFRWGADIVTHSTTKYMDGHAMCVGGAIVDSGNFDWSLYPEKFPGLCTPDESYHGIIYTEKFGKKAYITKATSQLMRDLGSIQSPMNAFLLNIGLETLHLRMPRHCENALKVAQYLENHEKVAWVNYPGLKSSKYYELAQKYMPNGTCGVISFGLKGGRRAAEGMMDKLELAAIVTHVADARTCVLHPASHTHRQMNDEQLKEAGVNPELIRFSVGLENADDIIADLEQALARI